jgi:hypothetical protein
MRSEAPPPNAARPWPDSLVEAVPVAVVAAVPTFLRARGAHEALETSLAAFALASALSFAPAFAALHLLRRARDGVRAFASDPDVAAAGIGAGAAAIAVASWERLGALLARATHHRGLGGVAFAAGALVLAAASALLARRVYRLLRAQGATVATFVGVAGLFAPLLLLFGRGAAAEPSPPADPLGLFVVDALGLLIASFAWVQHLAPSSWPPRARALVGAGAVLLVMAGATFASVTCESPRESLAFAFRVLPVR